LSVRIVLGFDVGQKPLERGSFHVGAGVAAVVMGVRNRCPALVPLAGDISFPGFALGIQRIESLPWRDGCLPEGKLPVIRRKPASGRPSKRGSSLQLIEPRYRRGNEQTARSEEFPGARISVFKEKPTK
jgi:hypothetical protein